MTTEIMLGDAPVLMTANAATARVYRQIFGSDLLIALRSAIDAGGKVVDVEVFENLAYTMARQAGSVDKTETIEDWLGQFGTLAIINAVGDIMALWRGNIKTTVEPKKKAEP